MGYSSGMLQKRVTVAKRLAAVAGAYGLDGSGVQWRIMGTTWASMTFSKGVKAMREGALDAYDTEMLRMRWNPQLEVTRECIVQYDGRWWQIESFSRDYRENVAQAVVREMVHGPETFPGGLESADGLALYGARGERLYEHA